MSNYHRGRGSDGAVSLILRLFVLFAALPIVGARLLLREDPSKRALGWVLLIIGIILWIIIGVNAA